MPRLFFLLVLAVYLAGCQSTPRHPDIYAAIRAGDLRDVQRHLDHGTPIDCRETGKTPLIVSVEAHQLAVAEHLLKQGANPNLATDRNFPPLVRSVQLDDSAMAALLVRYGANPFYDCMVGTKQEGTSSAFWNAMASDRVAICWMFLQHDSTRAAASVTPTTLSILRDRNQRHMLSLLAAYGVDTSVYLWDAPRQ